MTLTRQYLEATRQMQENWFQAVDAMTSQFSKKFDRPATTVFPTVDPRQAVDELFDFYAKALSVQRDTAHKILDANMQVSDQWNTQVEQFYAAWREQAQSMTDTARAQLESLTASSREQALQFGEAMEQRMSEAQNATREQAQRFMSAAQEQGERFMTAAQEQTERNAELAKEQTERAANTAKEQTGRAANAAKEQTDRAAEATKDAAQRNYNLMNTAQIKAELTSRGLETNGSLDELRARLREADGQA